MIWKVLQEQIGGKRLNHIKQNLTVITQVGKGNSEGNNDQQILTSKFVMRMFM